MDDLERPRRQGSATAADATGASPASEAGDAAAQQEDLDAAMMLAMARQQQVQAGAPSASEQAFGEPRTAAAPAPAPHPSAKPKPASSHDGGFTGFGAEFQPYTYTDPHENHGKLDPEVKRLGVQHTRVFVPFAAVQTGLLGKAGTDHLKANVDKLQAAAQAAPSDENLKKRLAAAQQEYAQAVSYVTSFVKTLELAGKKTTINLTFCGGTGAPETIDQFSQVVRYLVGQGFQKLQLTLENEPNGPDNGDGFRGRFDKGVRTGNQAESDEAAKEYVGSYQRLDADLSDKNAGNVRDQVSVVGGDMVPNNRTKFWETITRLGLNKYVDAYSFHIYWGANKGLGDAVQQLAQIQQLGSHIAKGKALQITEFGKERFTTQAERAKDPSHKGVHAVEQGVEPAFEQGLFALSAVNIGFTGVVKWDAFYGGEHHKGDGKGDPGQYYMIDQHDNADATYRLMRMFTHATEPGWRVHGTNHGVEGAEAHFRSGDGKGGAILAMSKRGGSVSTADLPNHEKLYVTTWNGNGTGGLQTHTLAPGARDNVAIPVNGAVAVSTRPIG